jgi:hypothetical protein
VLPKSFGDPKCENTGAMTLAAVTKLLGGRTLVSSHSRWLKYFGGKPTLVQLARSPGTSAHHQSHYAGQIILSRCLFRLRQKCSTVGCMPVIRFVAARRCWRSSISRIESGCPAIALPNASVIVKGVHRCSIDITAMR